MAEVSGSEAATHLTDVLKAVSGTAGINNATAILGEQAAEILKDAEAHKTAGNAHFTKGRFEEALAEYKLAMDLFEDFSPTMLDATCRKFLATVCSNSSQAYLKIGDGDSESDSARSKAEKALLWDPSNVKARYRRGCAYVKRHDWTLARSDFEWVVRAEPGNEDAKRELRKVLQKLRDDKATSWEHQAASAIKTGQCEDTRTASVPAVPEIPPAALLVANQIERAGKLHAGLLQYLDSKGHEDWKERMGALQASAEQALEVVTQRVSEVENAGGNLREALGEQGAALGTMSEEQRRTFLKADAFIAAVKQVYAQDLGEITALASKSEPLMAADNLEDPNSIISSAAAAVMDAGACASLAEHGVVVLNALSTLTSSCIARLRTELEAADSYGVLKKSEGGFRHGVVRNSVIEESYKGSALSEINLFLRGLAREIRRNMLVVPPDPRVCLGVPDDLHLAAFERGMRIERRSDASLEPKRIWGAILFVNLAWELGDGGEFGVFAGPGDTEQQYEMEPRAGRLIVFDAQNTWYETAVVEGSTKLFAVQFWIHSIPNPGYWLGEESD